MTTTEAPREMSGWERWAKRLTKSVLWVIVYFGGALALGFEPTMQLLALVVMCGMWGNILDVALPTATTDR